MKMEKGPSELTMDGDIRVTPEPDSGLAQELLRTPEASITGSCEGLQEGGPVDMHTSHTAI